MQNYKDLKPYNQISVPKIVLYESKPYRVRKEAREGRRAI